MSTSNIAEILAVISAKEKTLARARKRLSAAREGEDFDAWAALTTLEQLSADPATDEDLRRLVQASVQTLTKDVETLELELEATIRALCGRQDWRVDGQWPELFVERAIDVVWTRSNRQLSVAGRAVDGLGETRIQRALAPLVASLLPKGFKPEGFLERLTAAYDDVTSGRGGQAPLLDVYRAMVVRSQAARFWRDARKERFVGLALIQFRAQLTRALECVADSLRGGRELRLFPPISPSDAVFLYLPGEARFAFIGRIELIGRQGDAA